MAEIEDVYRIILNPMGVLYMAPRQIKSTEEKRQALLEYVAPLKGYSPEQLEQGWTRLKSTYTRSIWPSIGEIVQAVKDCIPTTSNGAYSPYKTDPERHEDKAIEVIKSPMGVEALAEGWGISLFEFVEKNGRSPDESEQTDLRHQARQIQKDLEEWKQGPGIVDIRPYIRARSAKLDRLHVLAGCAKPVESVS